MVSRAFQVSNKAMSRQIQANERVEKQLHKLGKQYKQILSQACKKV